MTNDKEQLVIEGWMSNAAPLFLIAVGAMKRITAPPRKGGQRDALVSVVFAAASLEAFLSEAEYHASASRENAGDSTASRQTAPSRSGMSAGSTGVPQWQRGSGKQTIQSFPLPRREAGLHAQRRFAAPTTTTEPRRPKWLQAKLAINQPGDASEQEADRVADAVMRMPATETAPASGSSHGAPAPAAVQRACACGGTCRDCREQAEILQRATPASASRLGSAPHIVYEVLRSPGQPLDASARAFMEPRFGHNFAQIRIHTDARAAESARAVHARAYTVGNHIVLGEGEFAGHTGDGGRLLAHELTHAVQQRSVAESGYVQRTCGQDVKQLPTSTCPVAVVAGGRPAGRHFKFDVNCDTFAPAEEGRLHAYLQGIPSNSELNLFGTASAEGDEGLNEQLACARVNVARKVIEEEHLGDNVKQWGGLGAVPGTYGDPEYRAVVIAEKKGGPPLPSSEPDIKNVFLVTGDKPDVIRIAARE
jgi:hypothetical protein